MKLPKPIHGISGATMRRVFFRILRKDDGGLRQRIAALYAVLIVANLGAWAWALIAFRDHPVLLGAAFLAYGFGLRHAVDADHIAAIDNVTRKLMQEGKRPVAIGFFFSLGHSTIVVLASVAIALTATAFKDRFDDFKDVGGVVGTLVSAGFLMTIAAMNMVILTSIYRTFRRVKAGAAYVEEDLDMILAGRGLFARLFSPMFRLIRTSWHMYPLGFLFGLGFDTATEVGLLGISAAQASQGLSIWSILVFPALFTAGMSLVDTTDSILMLGAYGWAFVKPIRKLYYNMTITLISVIVAILIGGIEALGLAVEQFGLDGRFWRVIGLLNDNFGTIGYLVIAIFVVSWIVSAVIYRARGYHRLELDAEA
ncbi:MAG TPA: HoxN/HupN/NixA family nickel/cobalt transporter [Aliidongia sp.]|uniref:HoxN/HupN/NixA family nickel/cobalt transporter n=1 Tax=Aliidongia sp. TaxID=1914230 RepID=UPI002DDDAB66|nr:HoxN/HupN/NixA family nickel/cobalt transporter [Aliidongia sp.]HEV2673014.1 HoxN/HupN/NixA family nickel/cobalt transporter [Aliidongia sp.]